MENPIYLLNSWQSNRVPSKHTKSYFFSGREVGYFSPRKLYHWLIFKYQKNANTCLSLGCKWYFISNSVLIALNVYEGEPGPLPCQNNSSFSRRNCITNQTDKFYMVKGSKKLIRSLWLHFLWFIGVTYIFLRLFKVHFQNGQLSIFNINW